MNATDLLNLADSLKPVLDQAMANANCEEDRHTYFNINQTAHHLIRQLQQVTQNQEIKGTLIQRAHELLQEYRVIAQVSCERYERLGGVTLRASATAV